MKKEIINKKNELEALYLTNKSLTDMDLQNCNLEKSYLVDANMKNCNLSRTNFSNSSLYGIDLSNSNLFKSNLKNVNLKNANLTNCNLLGANLENTKLENVTWGPKNKIINEIEAENALSNGETSLANEKYKEAEDVYRSLKICLQEQTLGNEASKFFIKQMIANRKQMPILSFGRVWSKIIDLTTGYGEKIYNIIFTMLSIVVISAILYGIEGVQYQGHTLGFFGDLEYYGGLINVIGNLIYFSIVVYTTVGFGEIVPIGFLGKSVMVFESIIGGLFLAIFIVAMYKKINER
tara:strand:+ start:105 stop:983 length:879 start_codon:yes stop_codon:yes gene_type:complete